MANERFKIVRFYFNRPGRRRTIITGLTLEDAQAHCAHRDTSSSTCTSPTARRRTRRMGAWFDGYETER